MPSCNEVLRLAQRARRVDGVLATVLRPGAPIVLDVTRGSPPTAWKRDPDRPGTLVPHGGGKLRFDLTVPRAGRYDLWLGGSFRRTATALADGLRVGSVTHLLNNDGQFGRLGAADLGAGSHAVDLEYGGSRLSPGSGGLPFALGPLVLGTTTADMPVTYVEPEDARSLCGKRLDWLEALSS
jgi:hypothetical protein